MTSKSPYGQTPHYQDNPDNHPVIDLCNRKLQLLHDLTAIKYPFHLLMRKYRHLGKPPKIPQDILDRFLDTSFHNELPKGQELISKK